MSLWPSIPGETPIDPSDLRDRSITARAELDRAEAISILDAHVRYFARRPTRRTAPFSFPWLLRLHKEMFGKVWKWAGRPRTRDVNIGVHWPQVPEQLCALLEDLTYWEKTYAPIEQAARLHWRAVWVHPFLGGNGRWARMLANIWLARSTSPIVLWPDGQIAEKKSAIRDDYMRALRAADHGDLEPLIVLHKRYADIQEPTS